MYFVTVRSVNVVGVGDWIRSWAILIIGRLVVASFSLKGILQRVVADDLSVLTILWSCRLKD